MMITSLATRKTERREGIDQRSYQGERLGRSKNNSAQKGRPVMDTSTLPAVSTPAKEDVKMQNQGSNTFLTSVELVFADDDHFIEEADKDDQAADVKQGADVQPTLDGSRLGSEETRTSIDELVTDLTLTTTSTERQTLSQDGLASPAEDVRAGSSTSEDDHSHVGHATGSVPKPTASKEKLNGWPTIEPSSPLFQASSNDLVPKNAYAPSAATGFPPPSPDIYEGWTTIEDTDDAIWYHQDDDNNCVESTHWQGQPPASMPPKKTQGRHHTGSYDSVKRYFERQTSSYQYCHVGLGSLYQTSTSNDNVTSSSNNTVSSKQPLTRLRYSMKQKQFSMPAPTPPSSASSYATFHSLRKGQRVSHSAPPLQQSKNTKSGGKRQSTSSATSNYLFSRRTSSTTRAKQSVACTAKEFDQSCLTNKSNVRSKDTTAKHLSGNVHLVSQSIQQRLHTKKNLRALSGALKTSPAPKATVSEEETDTEKNEAAQGSQIPSSSSFPTKGIFSHTSVRSQVQIARNMRPSLYKQTIRIIDKHCNSNKYRFQRRQLEPRSFMATSCMTKPPYLPSTTRALQSRTNIGSRSSNSDDARLQSALPECNHQSSSMAQMHVDGIHSNMTRLKSRRTSPTPLHSVTTPKAKGRKPSRTKGHQKSEVVNTKPPLARPIYHEVPGIDHAERLSNEPIESINTIVDNTPPPAVTSSLPRRPVPVAMDHATINLAPASTKNAPVAAYVVRSKYCTIINKN